MPAEAPTAAIATKVFCISDDSALSDELGTSLGSVCGSSDGVALGVTPGVTLGITLGVTLGITLGNVVRYGWTVGAPLGLFDGQWRKGIVG